MLLFSESLGLVDTQTVPKRFFFVRISYISNKMWKAEWRRYTIVRRGYQGMLIGNKHKNALRRFIVSFYVFGFQLAKWWSLKTETLDRFTNNSFSFPTFAFFHNVCWMLCINPSTTKPPPSSSSSSSSSSFWTSCYIVHSNWCILFTRKCSFHFESCLFWENCGRCRGVSVYDW